MMLRFANDEQRDAFSRACRGSVKHLASLPPDLFALATAACPTHRERSSRGGINQDPLRIRARWAGADECLLAPERQALYAIASEKAPRCKCRRCRLARAAERLARLRAGLAVGSLAGPGPDGTAYSWRDVWSEVPEAALSRGPL
jgi:hypothetical protein